MGIYLQHHPGKSLELLHYMEIIHFASTKLTGFGWRAYDEQFRVLLSRYQNTKCWSVIDQNLWLLCVTVPSVTKTSNSSNTGGSGPKKNGAFLKGGNGNQKSKGGSSNGNANGRKGGANQSGQKPVCRDYQMEMCTRTNCKFPHVCAWCRMAHPGDKCNNKR
jgi:hypothetical protein